MQAGPIAARVGRGSSGSARRRRPAAAAALLLLLAAAALVAPAAAEPKDDSEAQLELEYSADKNAKGEPAGTPTKKTIAGRTVYYEVPQAPKGMVAFFHGCNHNGFDHWYSQEACEECRGLPHEVSHTKQALSQGYAFVAMNSLNRQPGGPDGVETGKCFSYSEDKDSAVEALRELRQELDLQDKPLYLGGVSSGASFALKLINELKEGEAAGVFSEVLAVDPEKDSFEWGKWPPVAFLRMKHDPEVNARIGRNQAALKDAGVPAQVIEIPQQAVYWPSFFSDRASDIPEELSGRIVAALIEVGVIDAQGNILADPRLGFKQDWRAALRAKVPELDGQSTAASLEVDASAIYELLNTAWSKHEIDGDYMTAVLKWFEGGGKGDLQALADEWIIRKPAQLSFDRLQPGEKPATAGDPPIIPGDASLVGAPTPAVAPQAGAATASTTASATAAAEDAATTASTATAEDAAAREDAAAAGSEEAGAGAGGAAGVGPDAEQQ